MNKYGLSSLLLATLTTACTPTPPKCSDPKSIELLKGIITDNIHTPARSDNYLVGLTDQQLKDSMFFKSIRLTKQEPQIKKIDCEAVLTIPAVILAGDEEKVKLKYKELGPDWFGLIYRNNFLQAKQTELSMNVQYASQLDDNNQHVVIIDNFYDDSFLKLSEKFFFNLNTSYAFPEPKNPKQDTEAQSINSTNNERLPEQHADEGTSE